MIGDPRMSTSLDEDVWMVNKGLHLVTIQRTKYKGWAKLQYQMITQYQMCYMLLL